MKLRLGTRRSKLALWQAETIKKLIENLGHSVELVEIESFGDRVQDLPLHKLGDKGVFTKALDLALLQGGIDLAVHSLKDVPTELEDGLVLASVPQREDPRDALVQPLGEIKQPNVFATGSVRRSAFLKNKYPDHLVADLRGNVPTRLQKVDLHGWNGAIFAYAGLKRLGLEHRVSELLDWMIPAPAQGAIGIVSRDEEALLIELKKIESTQHRLCVDHERAFLHTLEAGCSSPVAALMTINNNEAHFHGAVLSNDGKQKLEVDVKIDVQKMPEDWGVQLAKELLAQGADQLIESR